MNVVISLTNNYITQAMVMLESLFNNNENVEFNVYALVESESFVLDKELNSFIAETSHNLQIIKVSAAELPFNKGIETYSIASYFRLIIPGLLPNTMEKVLYLDCDMLITRDITELYRLDLEHYFLGAIVSASYPKHLQSLKSEVNVYINSGVLLINLNKWRQTNFEEILIQNYLKYEKIIEFPDQDILSLTLTNIKVLENKWNFKTDFYKWNFPILQVNKQIEDEYAILHFTGTNKPWCRKKHVFSKLYIQALLNTKFDILRKRIVAKSIERMSTKVLISSPKLFLQELIFLLLFDFRSRYSQFFYTFSSNL